MFRHSIVFLCAVLVLSNVEFIQAGKYGGGGGSKSHSYPRSGGYSGGGSHSYPHSGGLSGNSGRGGGYPGGGGSHSYPQSGGNSGSHAYPNTGGSSGSHTYPSRGSNTGSHAYPNSGGLSGTNNHGSAGRGPTTINNHYHYNYNPPQQIHYTPSHGGPAMNYPVYRGTPPTYVYQYKDSGSKYGTLLAGLALFNLGALAGGAAGYAVGHSHNNNNNYNSYKPQAGEVCLFGIKKDNGDFEETRIECQLISSFIYAEQAKQQNPQNQANSSTVVTTVTNTTTINTANAPDTPSYILAPNGTLIPTGPGSPDAGNATNGTTGGSSTSQVTTVTVTNTTVNAVDVKGPSITVTPGMQCYVIRKTPSSRMKHEVPCGLLQTYADKSLKPNSAARNVPAFTILAVVCAVFINNF